MLTYLPPQQRPVQTHEHPWLLLLLCLAWVVPGILYRQPIKPDEVIIADIVRRMLEDGNWIVPIAGGEPWLAQGPLYYWIASICAWLGQWGGLALHDGARLSSGLLLILAFWGIGLAGFESIGRRHGRSAVLILMGSAGLLLPAHMLSTDSAMLASWCWGYYALALASRAPVRAGLLLATALLFVGLSTTLLQAFCLLACALGLLWFVSWQQRRYLSTTLALALGLALPLILAWPAVLLQRYPHLATLWWQAQFPSLPGLPAEAGAALPWLWGWGLRFWQTLVQAAWFAWPGWFLAAATLWMQRDRLRQPHFQLPLLGLVAACCYLLGVPQQQSFLLLLPPLALIGAVGMDALRRATIGFFNGFGILCTGLLILVLWVTWSAFVFGFPEPWAKRLVELAPNQSIAISGWETMLGGVVTAVWLMLTLRRHPLGRQALSNWVIGVMACWMLAVLFMRQWVDTRTAYHEVSASLASHLPPRLKSETIQPDSPATPGAAFLRAGSAGSGAVSGTFPRDCMASDRLQRTPRAAFHYYLGFDTLPLDGAGRACSWVLRQSSYPPPAAASDDWRPIWNSRRTGDASELFLLYYRGRTGK